MYYIFCLISILYTAFCVYFFVYKKIRDLYDITMKFKIIFISLIFTLYFIYIPVFIIIVDSVMLRPIIISLFFMVGILLFGILEKRFKKKYERVQTFVNFSILKVFYIVFYIPIVVLYFNRFESLQKMAIITLLYTLSALLIDLMFKLLNKTRFNRILSFLSRYSVLFIWVIFLLFIQTDIFNLSEHVDNPNLSNIYVQFEEMELDYNSINHLIIEDEITDADLIDFYYDDEYLYYIIANKSDAYYRVYSNDIKEVVYSRKLTIPSEIRVYRLNDKLISCNDIISKIDDTIYFFSTDGIYIIDGTTEVKIADFSALDTLGFDMNEDAIDFYYSPSDDIHQIFLVNEDGLVLVEELDFSEDADRYFLRVITDKLVIRDKESSTYQIYEGPLFAPSSLEDEYPTIDLLTDSHMIYHVNNGPHYILYSDGTIQTIKDLNQRHYNMSIHSERYYENDILYSSFFNNNKQYFYDEKLNKLESYKPIILSSSIFGEHETPSTAKSFQDEHYYYGAYIKTEDSISFEINEYVIINPTIDLDYFNFINSTSVWSILIVSIIPSITLVKKKNPDETID